ncbi:unnamed protein product [Ostreobium quekettii]|uniref:Uncharacterized protein n=1 Tax=Ostreobium quekettii TaxID=121088 RepID=A0A8S1IUH1_9CHLO|nr:unnamed protein product [Ostreobium quekettii]|eukprot:evm.model.scf_146.6 EVM.evm.TU.scf_146.6   scf_146:130644-133394(+)
MPAAAAMLWWLVLLTGSWQGPVAQADWHEEVQTGREHVAVPSRHLLAPSAGRFTVQEAEETLRGFGIEHGPILYMGKTADCPLRDLPENDTATLTVYCASTARMRACRGREGRPLFHMTCQNETCVDSLSFSATACNLNGRLGIPLEETVNRSCELSVPETDDALNLHMPFFLTPDGERSIFDCLFAWPTNSTVLIKYVCVEGFFSLEVSTFLGSGPLVPGKAEYHCIRDTRCGGEGEDGGLQFDGEFICYLPKGSRVALTNWAAGRGARQALFLGAPALALLFAAL